MPLAEVSRIDIAELARAFQAADPSVLLVPSRILRRVIKQDCQLTTLGLQVPHPKTFVISRQALLQIAEPRELELEPGRELAETLILVARPEPVKLAQMSAGEALVKFWRRVFHARLHLALEQRLKETQVTEAGIRQRIQRIGQTEFNEARSVLLQENYLLPPQDDRSTYIEFAAVYLELRHFGAGLLPHYFPSLTNLEAVDALLAEDVDAAAVAAAARPPGAPDPRELSTNLLPESEEEGPEPVAAAARPPEAARRDASRQAEQAAARGNDVRAAILLAWRSRTPRAGRAEIHRLVNRLQEALGMTAEEAAAWRRALPALLPAAADGFWPTEARLLYDLQKICLDHERGIYAIDPVEWLRSLGRRPLRRPLPAQREVLALKRLRRGLRRLGSTRLAEGDRARLARLFEAAVARAEARLRAHFRPLLGGALDGVSLVPANLPEEVARDKVVQELLDKVVEDGHVTMGDLRDSLSRNQLKLDDVAGPREFLSGDPLLRLNRELARTLDGVYHRGEIYLRLLQRFSALAFGTRPGRFLTQFFALPFGGAFVLLKGPDAVAEEWFHTHLHLAKLWKVGVLGVFLLLLFNVSGFRRLLGQGLRQVGRGLRTVFIDVPGWVLRQPPVRAVLESRPVLFFRRYLLMPLLLTGVTAEVALVAGLDNTSTEVLSGSFFVIVFVLCASRIGRDVSETLADWLARGWRRLSLDLLPGLFRLIMDFFKRLLETVQRFLYTIDEWLRFRGGEGRLSLLLKAVAAPVWHFVTYVIRFAVNVLIEPQINPIKHFPVVTVSHKLLFPMIFVLDQPVAEFTGWDRAYTRVVLTLVITSIPGFFGFMTWELKENWFLYRSNRPRALRPVLIGHHGETMVRLLRRGFHSGTVPKLHAKLRKAERRGRPAAARKALAGLHHVEECVRHFVERELVSLLHKSLSWGGLPLDVGEVVLASNRIRVELTCSRLSGGPLWLVFDEQQGWLLAGIGAKGWVDGLSPVQHSALAAGLTGLYKMAAVALVREQIRANLPTGCVAYDLTPNRLVVWPDANYEAEVAYELRNGPVLLPLHLVGVSSMTMPVLHANRLLFAKVPLTWEAWVAAWERDRTGAGLPEPLLPGIRVLPAEERKENAAVT
jgi:hypothetical protein